MLSLALLASCGRADFDPSGVPCHNVQVLPAMDRMWGLTTADFDRDGHLDLVAVAYDNAKIWLGDGSGAFGPLHLLATPSGGMVGVATADFNGDGKPDFASATGFARSVVVMLGNGDGTFTAAPTVGFAFDVQGVTAADLDSNGTQDLIVTGYNAKSAVPLLGNGDGTFAMLAASGTLNMPGQAEALDINGDGVRDLVIPTPGTHDVAVLLGTGNAMFTAATGYGPHASSTAPGLAVGDFDHNGTIDLIVAGDDPAKILLGNGDGTFANGATISSAGYQQAIATADFDGDGNLDIVIATMKGAFEAFRGHGDGTFTPSATYTPAGGGYAAAQSSIAIGDFDGDGTPDVAIAADQVVSVYPSACLP